MADYLTYYALRQPEKDFLHFEDQQMGYGAFHLLTDRLARGLSRMKVSKGDRCVIFMNNCPEFLLSFVSLMKIGAIAVPINTSLKKDEVEYCVRRVGSKIVFTQAEFYGMFADIRKTSPVLEVIIVIGGQELESRDFPFESLRDEFLSEDHGPDVLPDDLLAILFTSGTTARPKGVMLSHRNFVYAAEVMAKHQGLGPEDRYICVLPFFHSTSLTYGFMATLTVGGSLIILPRFSTTQWWDQVTRYRGTRASLTGTIWRILLRLPPTPLEKSHSIRTSMYGLPLSEEEFQAVEKRFGLRLLQGYGMTETVCSASIHPLYGPRSTLPSSVGFPTIGTEVKVVDEDGKEIESGCLGEILVKTLCPFPGYYDDPVATEMTIKEGWIRTGDLGYIDHNGGVHFMDRKKDMIKPKGENVAASEIESVLLESPKIEEVAVVGVKDLEGIWGEKIKAFIVLKGGERMTENEVQEHCRKKLADFKVPHFVEFRASLPKTTVGKIDKKLLKG